MPIFHFNTSNGTHFHDVDGTELGGVDAAKLEGLRHIGEMLIDRATRAEQSDELRLDVTDHRGLVLFTVMVSIFDAPVLRR